MILNKFRQTIDQYNMLEAEDRVVVGVSGGPDSVALLCLLNHFKKQMRLFIHIAHLDHMLRVEESRKDRQYVEDLANRMHIPITVGQVNLSKLTTKGSMEEVARKLRYDFFLKVAKKIRARKIALGHTRDDQAETVLMRILRGTGLLGLRGIPPVRPLQHYVIIRPLIKVWRSEIERFLIQKRIEFRQDSSNLEPIFFRNRIRNELIPHLKKEYNLNIKEILANMADMLTIDYQCLSQLSQRALRSSQIKETETRIVIQLKRLLRFHRAIQRMVSREAIERLRGNTRRLTYQHWKELEDLIDNRPNGSVVDLPQGVSVLKKQGEIIFYLRH